MDKPLVSIIINNYNYGHFLRHAVESALDQTYSYIEVIVVDDGSTDNSQQIIAEYADTGRVILVLKENGGQASAFNAGFAVSKGEIVVFLDADDVICQNTIEEVIKVWHPKLSKVQWRLQLVNERLEPLPATWPGEAHMPSGDLRETILRWRYYPSPPTSGNAFSRWLLERILPMPESEWRIAADSYLLTLAALYGEICSIDKVLGYYRVHGGNLWHYSNPDIPKLIQQVKVGNAQKRLLEDAAREMGMEFKGNPLPHACKTEMALAILAPQELKSLGITQNRLRIGFNGMRSTIVYPYIPTLWARIRLIIWFILSAILPLFAAHKLAILGLFPSSRPFWLARLFRLAWRLSPKEDRDG